MGGILTEVDSTAWRRFGGAGEGKGSKAEVGFDHVELGMSIKDPSGLSRRQRP